MDYRKSALEVLAKSGGIENLESVTHCATRLRLVLKEDEKCNRAELDRIEGVKGVFDAAGQVQIIFGPGTVKHIYDEFLSVSGIQPENQAGEYSVEKKGVFRRILQSCKKYLKK